MRKSDRSSLTSTSGTSLGSRVSMIERVQRCSRSEVDVFLAVADHLDQAVLEALDLAAEHFHLPLLQRNGALAMRILQLHCGEKFCMPLKEPRRIGEVVGNVLFGNALNAGHSVISPSKTVAAGPVMSTGAQL